MKTCIQINEMPKTTKNDDSIVVSFRIRGAAAARFMRLLTDAQKINKYINKTDIALELIGLATPDILTQEKIEYFRAAGLEATPTDQVLLPGKSGDNVDHQYGTLGFLRNGELDPETEKQIAEALNKPDEPEPDDLEEHAEPVNKNPRTDKMVGMNKILQMPNKVKK